VRSSRAAIRWYEAKRRGLGGEFYDAVVHAIDLIRANPEIGSPRSGRLAHRRFVLTRFPYTIVYRERETDVNIVAIAQTSRRPGYWTNRR
jgi:plasmid stabilization system protein ParE